MRKPKKRKINAARIRQNRSYDRREISRALAIHKNTISHWVREGLRPMDNQRPELFHGSELVRFIKLRQQKHKSICAENEMYCLKCRAPRTAIIGSVSIEKPNEKTANLIGKCCVCSNTMNRRISVAKVAIFEETFEIKKRQFSHLIEPQDNRLNCDNSEPNLTTAKKPKILQPDLFGN
ncbi:MAG: hypothetical protein J0L55_17520 [Caulobacterales bacterium]|nr:hypothetical protein [Caulobacterales bacterium]